MGDAPAVHVTLRQIKRDLGTPISHAQKLHTQIGEKGDLDWKSLLAH